ncbi:MAG: discoidin domain-containing protein [Verrucomicrobia bacterium]|nr:discoidin domain-containing protein [Verrucomicrobiota bacterium]
MHIIVRLIAVAACLALPACPAGAQPNQGLDEATGIVHNGQWQNGVPLGAMGCGKFDVLPSGWFSRFSINHNWDEPLWDHPWRPSRATFFAIRAAKPDAAAATRWLRFGFREQELPSVTQVAHVAYRGQIPFVDARFEDAALPVDVSLHAWSALVPHNAKDSSLPVAFFEFTLSNTNAQPVEASLLFSLEHFIGCGGYQVHGDHKQWREQEGNRVEPAAVKDSPLTGLRLFSTKQFAGMKLNSSGEYWLLSDGPTTARGWDAASDGQELVAGFSTTGELERAESPKSPSTAGAICRKVTVPAGGKQKVLFAFVWWMPRHVTMDGKDHGHYYLRDFQNPQALAAYAFAQRERLHRETAALGKLVTDSSLPAWLQRLILNSTHPVFVNTLLTRDGEFSVHEDPSWMEGALGTMDQRTVAHVFVGTFFPELARSEMELFSRCQQVSGEVTHFCGNIYQIIGDPRVFYGITRWPDLSAVYIWQVLKHYRWTGDRAFLDQSWPGIKRALDWMVTTDRDGDGIPEGGTTFDAGVQYAGGFVFTASVYGAALLSAMEIATVEGDAATRAACAQRLEKLRATMRQRLWTGQSFAKCYLPDRGMVVPTLFTAQLAGDWLTRAVGLPGVVSAAEAQSSLESLLKVNGRSSPWVFADEFMPDGSAHNDTCWFTYQATYFAGLAMAEGWADDAMEVAWRIYEGIFHYYKIPWGMYINISPTLKDPPQGGASYMSLMATWWWLHQLAGASLDVPGQTLWLSPRPPSSLGELHMPLFFPRVWFWLDYAPAKNIFRLKVLRKFGETVVFKRVGGDPNAEAVQLAAPFAAEPDAVLDLASLHGKLVTVTPRPAIVEHRTFSYHREGLPTLPWTAIGSDANSGFHAEAAYDGFAQTRWESSTPVSPDLWWQLDMGAPQDFKTVEAVTSPPGLTIELSADGKQWQLMDATVARHRARYLRLRPAPQAPTKDPWRVIEVTVRP